MTVTKKKRKNGSTGATLTTYFLTELSRAAVASRSILIIAMLCVHFESAEGDFIETPKNAIVIVNHPTVFNCATSGNNSNTLIWYHHPLVGSRAEVYGSRIRDNYFGRFRIANGTFNLLVERPEIKDAGRYECVDDPEEDKGPSAELTVLDSNLLCESANDLNEIVGPTECSKPIAPDQLQLQCSVTYSGNLHPQMEWRKVGSELESSMTNCGERGNRVYMCNATLEANINMDGSVYICQITTAKQYNCSVKVNKIIYTVEDTSVRNITIKEEVDCSANTSNNLSCSYKWYKDNKTEEQFGQTLKPSNPGIYRCEAKCQIRNETCSLTAKIVKASEPVITLTEASKAGLIIGIIAAVLIAGGIIAIVVWNWKKIMDKLRKRKRNEDNRGNENPALGPPIQRDGMDGANAVNIPLLPTPTGASNETDKTCTICAKEVRPRRGLNGYVFGPEKIKDIQYACEQILLTDAEKTRMDEVGDKNIENWRRLKHTNLIKIHDKIVRPTVVHIVIYYAAGKSIKDVLRNYYPTGLKPEVVKDWATQIARGLEYLHGEGIFHKNIRSTQVFILEEIKKKEDILEKALTLQIGCINFLGNDAINDGTSLQENACYRPSELKLTEARIDIWSFSVVVWELLTGKKPAKHDSRSVTEDLKNPNLCPEKLKEILLDPSDKRTFTVILNRLQTWDLSLGGITAANDADDSVCASI